jgi:hypothetical protein
MSQYEQGYLLESSNPEFIKILQDAIDYRGDTTLNFKEGESIEGFLFNKTKSHIDIFPKDAAEAQSYKIDTIDSVLFSGKDEAKGRSWEDYQKRKQATSN